MVRAARRWRTEHYRKTKRVGARCFWVIRGPNGALLGAYTDREDAEERARSIPGASVRYECSFFINDEG